MATYSRYHGAERRRYGHRLQVYTKVLWLNRQIRDEALPFLYGQHLHFACSPDGVDAFLKDQPDDVLGSIRHVTLVIPSETGRMKFMSLCSFMARALRLKILGVRVNTFLWGVNPFEKLLERKGDIRLFLTLDWVQSLLAIRDLDSLNIAFNDRYMMKMVDMSAELTKSLQARMLTRNVYNRAELEDWLRTEKHVYAPYTMPKVYFIDFIAVYLRRSIPEESKTKSSVEKVGRSYH
ncbi:MAG: hypothetical protein L6R39_006865 [Caloplaca ligustica]|nr:MAG: hypothetical protein L6R39_006865 [Caloplaca ligustica]